MLPYKLYKKEAVTKELFNLLYYFTTSSPAVSVETIFNFVKSMNTGIFFIY